MRWNRRSTDKKNKKNSKKGVDKHQPLCYTNINKRENNPNTKGDNNNEKHHEFRDYV